MDVAGNLGQAEGAATGAFCLAGGGNDGFELCRKAILEAIAGNVPDCIFCKDLQRRYTFVNPAMVRLLGRSADELLGKTPEEIYDPESAKAIREVDEWNLAGGDIDETRELTIAGHEYVFHTVQVPIRDAQGRITSLCGVVRNVTELVRAQAELKQHRENLARQVQEKTAELTAARDLLAQQLEDLGKMRKALDTAQIRAQAQICHDLHDGLGQTLTGIQYQAAALRQTLAKKRSPLAEMALKIEGLAQSAVQETKRIAKGVIPIELAEEGLAVALGNLARWTSSLAGVECVCQCCLPGPKMEVAMAFELFQIAKEGVSNAVQHAEASRIDIRLAPVAGEDGSWRLEVSDDGKGFRPAKAMTGTGLELMQHRGANLGGCLTFQSTPGHGTTVACRFAVATSRRPGGR